MRWDLANLEGIDKEYDFDFSKNTTYGLGGKASVAFFPRTEEQAIETFKLLVKNYSKHIVLGRGSNLLVSNTDFDGAVLCTKYLNKISVVGNVLRCQSGVSVSNLMNFCLLNGITGLEYLAGIPASIGGLALMNGGTSNRKIGDDVLSIRIFDGQVSELSNKKCDFGNKHSIMRDINSIILTVDLNYTYADTITVKKTIARAIELRKGQPKGKSCGCVFKNPYGLSAGKLIDEAGLKGLRCGDAFVSSEHANFIINNGRNSNDVYRLISTVKQKVFEIFGVLLEEEVVYIGEFNEFDS